MHITPVEAALAGVVFSPIVGATTALLVQRFTRRSAHTGRLWERRSEVYEFMLSQAAWWRSLRRDSVRAMKGDDLADLTEDSERRRLYVRLSMFGEPDVREAFDRSFEADKAFVIAFIGWRDKARLNAQVERGEVPEHQAIEGSELTRLRKAAEAACSAAGAREAELIDAVLPQGEQEHPGVHLLVLAAVVDT